MSTNNMGWPVTNTDEPAKEELIGRAMLNAMKRAELAEKDADDLASMLAAARDIIGRLNGNLPDEVLLFLGRSEAVMIAHLRAVETRDKQ